VNAQGNLWKLLKAAAILVGVLWAFFVALYVWKTYEAARLGCNYAAHAAQSADANRGMVSDMGSGCF
jgi:hypothetical protein